MIVEIILGFLIGSFLAPNKKIGFVLGFVCGIVWGLIAITIFFGPEERQMGSMFLLIVIVLEGLITGLCALVVTHGKLKKKAKSIQNLTKKFD